LNGRIGGDSDEGAEGFDVARRFQKVEIVVDFDRAVINTRNVTTYIQNVASLGIY
jgi:hypothetical protein